MTPKQAMKNTAAILFVIGIAWLLIQIREILIILILAITFAAAIAPLVIWLRGRGLSQSQSIVAIYATVLLILGIAGYLLIPPLVSQGTEFVEDVPTILEDLEEQARASDSRFLRTSGARALDRAGRRYEELRSDPAPLGDTAMRYAGSVLNTVFGIFSLLVITYYWVTQRALVKRVSLGFVPLARRENAYRIWDEIELRLGGWVRGQLLLSGIIGGVSMAGYWLLGLDYWLTLGIIAGITEVIPFLGPIIGGGVAVLVALTDSPEKALLTLAFVFALQQIEGAILVPRVMENAVGLNPLSVVLAVLIGGRVLGPLGAVLAIPLAAALQVLVAHLWEERDDEPESTTLTTVEKTGGTAPAATVSGASNSENITQPKQSEGNENNATDLRTF